MNLSRKWVVLVLAISLSASLVSSQAMAYGPRRPVEGPSDPPMEEISGEPEPGGSGKRSEYVEPDAALWSLLKANFGFYLLSRVGIHLSQAGSRGRPTAPTTAQ